MNGCPAKVKLINSNFEKKGKTYEYIQNNDPTIVDAAVVATSVWKSPENYCIL